MSRKVKEQKISYEHVKVMFCLAEKTYNDNSNRPNEQLTSLNTV
jgi:hypothetical protein